ncbi:MAG: DUF4386 domain-containing protein [Candidatus Promineifilaceae bacterium]
MINNTVVSAVEMEEQTFGGAQRTAAIVAGLGLVLMMFPAILANFFVIQNTFVPGDAAATMNNLLANEFPFRLAVLGFIVVAVLDVIVAWGLYIFFVPTNRGLSLLGGWFRLVYSAVLVMAIMELIRALSLLQSAAGPAGVQMALQSFNDAWDLGLVMFGLHLVLVGVLALQTAAMPKWLGVLVLIAGVGYVFDSIAGLLLPDFGIVISQVTFVGEMLLAVWLLVKSVTVKRWQQFALKTAQ